MSRLYPDTFYVLALCFASAVFGWKIAIREYLRWRKEAEEAATETRKLLLEQARHQAETLLRETEALANKKRTEILQESERQLIEVQEKKLELIALLERASSLDRQSAVNVLRLELLDDATRSIKGQLLQLEKQFNEEATRKARSIITASLQRVSRSTTSFYTVSSVTVPSEDYKGRIIGREGRNVRLFESLTGIDVIIDETPNTVFLSSHHPLRRHVAAKALTALVADGRIHPEAIEQAVATVTEEFETSCLRDGTDVASSLGLESLALELKRAVGQLQYFEANGQNLLEHSLEVADISRFIAAELGLDAKVASRAGLLHDVGKVTDGECGLDHAESGAQLAEKYGESSVVVEAIRAHHQDLAQHSEMAVIVALANTLSASRPGARKEPMETFIKRMTQLEELAMAFHGVNMAYAVQAGRELRVMVDCAKVAEPDAALLAREIAKKITEEVTYAERIRVSVIRETRAAEYTL